MTPQAREQIIRHREREWIAEMLVAMWEERERKCRKLGIGPTPEEPRFHQPEPQHRSVLEMLLD